ncbi:serine aminopeptidase S33 family [Sediminitomix flava]|uniref:Serine aminopeptidase S33 family n=2 Tax=Sediminitomix flava TaxID=379075 RepID=A0A315ZFE3_SEDFL|nr:serine aminopeptidase S33 family [Sediminitomix flava]
MPQIEQKVEKKKIPLNFRIIRWLFPKVEKISLSLSGKMFVYFFFKVFRLPINSRDKALLDQAKQQTLKINGYDIQVYVWGEGKPILLVHGWMGKVSQFSKFIEKFTQEGYACISFDLVGHGKSEGNRTHLLEASELILEIQKQFGDFEMVVGHSLGGVASLLALTKRKFSKKLMMIASPAIANEILDGFCRNVNASNKNYPYFLSWVQNQLGRDFYSFEAKQLVEKIEGVDLLLAYDTDDDQVSEENPKVMKQSYPSAKVIYTSGLGHNKIVRDESVVSAAYDHLTKSENSTAPIEKKVAAI